jgi:hypothetical protein
LGGPYIAFQKDGVQKGSIGYSSVTNNFVIENDAGTATNLEITDAGAVMMGPADNSQVHDIRSPTQTTVGAAGGASALPATPTGYVEIKIKGTTYVIPYYAKS